MLSPRELFKKRIEEEISLDSDYVLRGGLSQDEYKKRTGKIEGLKIALEVFNEVLTNFEEEEEEFDNE